MADITVQRHGDRWAVLEAGAESPTKEFDTREAAEAEARHLGGTVEVREDDPSGLGHDGPDREPVPQDPGSINAVPAAERVRSVQTGL
jgi:hypothetical protein